MLSEDIEPTDHLIARNMIQEAMILYEYEVIPAYHLDVKYTLGNPNRSVIPAEIKGEYYHEFDLFARKYLENGLIEEIAIEIGNEDDWDTRHSPMNNSKYVYHKQMGNDSEAEDWLHRIKPDAILIRPSKGEVITFDGDSAALFHHIKQLARKYVKDFVIEKSSTKF